MHNAITEHTNPSQAQKQSKAFVAPTPVIQKKLKIGASDDPMEAEADRVADQVVQQKEVATPPSPNKGSLVQKKCNGCEEEELQKKPLAEAITPLVQKRSLSHGGGTVASEGVSNKIQSSRGGGSPMEGGTRGFMENRFGNDFSNVRIHTDSNAIQLSKSLNAQAFTVGNDIYFNQGKYNPSSFSGKHLLAHELTHTIQQGGIQRKIQREPGLEVDQDAAVEGAIGNHKINRVDLPGRIGARVYTETRTETILGFDWDYEVELDNYDTIKTQGKKIYNGPGGSTGVKFKLKFNELAQVIGITDDDWALISSSKGYGWVPKYYVHYPVPDLRSQLHFVRADEKLKDIVANHYRGQNVDLTTWGKDTRLYVHAVALVNSGRKGIGYYKSKEEISTFREIFLDKTGEESQRIWNSAYLKKGHNIWLPSLEIIKEMDALGQVSAGSVSYTVVEALIDGFLFYIGMQIGVFEGLWAAFVDTLSGIVDLVKLIGTLVEKIINGELLDYLKELWEGLKGSITGLPDTLKKAWEEFMAMSAFDKGRAVGKIIGMILFEVLIAYFTAGAVSAIKWSGKAGKLASAFRKLPDIDLKSKKIKGKVDPPDANTKKRIQSHLGNKKQKQDIGDVESGKIKLEGYDGHKKGNHKRKGNYGEMKMDVHLEEMGYKRISGGRVVDIDQKIERGIDGVFENTSPPPKYVIAESKYGSSKLSQKPKDGPQMSDSWIEGSKRLEKAVGKDVADDILLEGYDRVLVHVDDAGNVTTKRIDANGKVGSNWP